jgi:hypothetical protein
MISPSGNQLIEIKVLKPLNCIDALHRISKCRGLKSGFRDRQQGTREINWGALHKHSSVPPVPPAFHKEAGMRFEERATIRIRSCYFSAQDRAMQG